MGNKPHKDTETESLDAQEAIEPGLAEGRGAVALRTALMALAAAIMAFAVWSYPRPVGDAYVGLAAGRDVVEGKLGQTDEWSFRTDGSMDDPDQPARVWINQNWGTHLTFYLSHQAFGLNGLLVVKAAWLVIMGVFLSLACHQRGARWPVAVLVAGGTILSGYSFIDLRPNLTSLALFPVMAWLLYRTRRKPHRIWWATLLAAWWANMHGGFFFGIGMMGLWALCQTIPAILAGLAEKGSAGAVEAIKRYWPLSAATALAIVAAGTITPFGLHHALSTDTFVRDWNLTHPLVVGRSALWRQVLEWRPVLYPVKFATRQEFVIVLATVCIGGMARVMIESWRGATSLGIETQAVDEADPTSPRSHLFELASTSLLALALAMITVYWAQDGLAARWPDGHDETQAKIVIPLAQGLLALGLVVIIMAGVELLAMGVRMGKEVVGRKADLPSPTQVGTMCFDLLLSALVVYMAFESRRFIPLASIILAPVVAMQLSWLTGVRLRLPSVPTGSAMGSGVLVVAAAVWVLTGRSLSSLAFLLAGAAVLAVYYAVGALRSRRLVLLPVGVVAVMLLVPAVQLAYGLWSKRYNPRNPTLRLASVAGISIAKGRQPFEAQKFLRANDIRGRVYNEWRWEGYLHWTNPQLKLFTGGRAQQIYSAQDYQLGTTIRMYPESSGPSTPPDRLVRSIRRLLQVNGVTLVATPVNGYVPLRNALIQSSGATWTYLYTDGFDQVLADTADPNTRRYVADALRGRLTYPHKAYEALTRALIIQTPAGYKVAVEAYRRDGLAPPGSRELAELLMESVEAKPLPLAWSNLQMVLQRGQVQASDIVGFVEARAAQLDQTDHHRPGGAYILLSRGMAHEILALCYRKLDRPEESLKHAQAAKRAIETYRSIPERWM